jgi:hypothetical protein
LREHASHRGCGPLSSRDIGFFRRATVTRSNILYLIIGALVVAVTVLGYQLYQDRHPPQGMSINFGPNGVSIQGGGK